MLALTKLVGPALLVLASCASNESVRSTVEFRGTVAADSIDEDVSAGFGAGMELAVSTPIVDTLAAFDTRRFEDDWLPELSLGLRKRLAPEIDEHGFRHDNEGMYLFALARSDRSGTDGDAFVNGYSAGVGWLAPVEFSFFFDVRLAFERTTHLDTDHGGPDVNSVAIQWGFGF
jgi:hypothetical protein